MRSLSGERLHHYHALVGILGALITGGGAIVAGGIAWARRNLSDQGTVVRLLRREPRTPIARVVHLTRAKIIGTTRVDEETLELPLLGRPCLAYELEIRQRPGKKLLDPFIRTHLDVRMVSMLVEDSTGVARCEGRLGGVALRPLRVRVSDAKRDALLSELGLETGIETVIRLSALFENEGVAVHGLVTMESTADADAAGFRGAMQRPLIGPNRKTGLYVSNRPRAV